MRFNEAFPSAFFKAGDLTEKSGTVLTIKRVTTEAMHDGEERRCASFEETDKRLLLNKTNWLKCAELTGEEDDNRWAGHKIRLVKKRVPFKGDLVDSVRVDAAEAPF